MDRFFNQEPARNAFSENFDCNKMKSLIMMGNSNLSFSDRFSNWISQYTKEAKEKIWVDIESYKSK